MASLTFLFRPSTFHHQAKTSLIQGPSVVPTSTKVRSISQVPGGEELWGPDLLKRILAIQVAADKDHDSFISEKNTQHKLEKVCDELFSMTAFHFHVCDLMYTNQEVGEAISEILAEYRYAKSNEEKIELRERLLVIYGQVRGLTFSTEYLLCSGNQIKILGNPTEDYLDFGFDLIGAADASGLQVLSSQNLAESLQELISALDEKAKIVSHDLHGLFIVINSEKDEIQYCPFVHRYSRKDFKHNDAALFKANARTKDPLLKQKYLNQALLEVLQELKQRMIQQGVSPDHGQGRIIFEREKRLAEARRDWFFK